MRTEPKMDRGLYLLWGRSHGRSPMCCRLIPLMHAQLGGRLRRTRGVIRHPLPSRCPAVARPLPPEAPSPAPRCDTAIPFASIRLGLGLAEYTQFMLNRLILRSPLRTCAVPGTHQLVPGDAFRCAPSAPEPCVGHSMFYL